jgi:hypothetical protein
MRQSDIERILDPGEPVPDGEIFGNSTKSTPRVKLGRVKAKYERGGPYTVDRLQCYALRCELPAELERRCPVLFKFASALNSSTSLSVDQLASSTKIWPDAVGDSSVWNAVSRLEDPPWNLNIVSTGYRQKRLKVDAPTLTEKRAAVPRPAPKTNALPDRVTGKGGVSLPFVRCLNDPSA